MYLIINVFQYLISTFSDIFVRDKFVTEISTVCPCRNGSSKLRLLLFPDTGQNLAANLSSDLTQVSQWRKDWLIKFNTAQTKLVTFYHHHHHHWADLELSLVVMDGSSLKEDPCFERLLELKLSSLKWDSYIWSVANDCNIWFIVPLQ